MTYYFVDYENVHSDGIVDCTELERGDVVCVIYTEQAKNITLDIIEKLSRAGITLELDKAGTGAKNSLDFQLSSYLGYVIARHEKEDAAYVIVSKDTGFDRLVDFWGERGIRISRAAALSGESGTAKKEKKEKKPAQKRPARNKKDSMLLVTREEALQYLSEEEYSDEILEIVNSFKTKQAINNGLSKKYRDNKKSSEIYKKLKPLMKEKKKS